jgi:hypothetical protein
MGRKAGGQNQAVRLCVRCTQLKPALAFPPGRPVCTTCQPAQEPHRRRRGNTQRVVEATRARGRALRRLALESILRTTGRPASGDWRPARLGCRRSRRGGERSPTARATWPISIASGSRSCTDRSCNAPGWSGARSVRAVPLEPETRRPSLGVVRPDLAATSHPEGPSAAPSDGASTGATGQTPSGARGRAVRRPALGGLGRSAARRRPPDGGQLAGPLARRGWSIGGAEGQRFPTASCR